MNRFHSTRSAVTILRTFWVLLILVGVSGTSVLAQSPRQQRTPEEIQNRFDAATNEMIEALELTDEQKPLFMDIMDASNADRMKLLEDMRNGGDRSSMREKMMALNSTTTEALSSVLTESQLEKYNSILAERREQGRNRQRPNS